MPTDGTPTSVVVRYPEQEKVTIDNPLVRDFCDYCLEVKPEGDFADRADFDPFKLRPWLGFIVIVDHLPSEDDFRYRMYGTRIAEQTGHDMTGRLVSEYDTKLRQINLGLYRECVAKRALLHSTHHRIYARFDCEWSRIICPVRAGDQVQVVVCNVPVETPKPR